MPPLIQFAVQQVIAITASYFVLFALLIAKQGFAPNHGETGITITTELIVVVSIVAPLWAGNRIPSYFDNGPSYAKYAFVMPTFVMLAMIYSEAHRYGVRKALSILFNLFGPPNQQTGEELAIFFFTLPALSSIAYSIGATLVKTPESDVSRNLRIDHFRVLALSHEDFDNLLLDFVLTVEEEKPGAEEAPINSTTVAPERVASLVHNHFYGPVGILAQQSLDIPQRADLGAALAD